MPESKEFTLDSPPGDEWVLLRSGCAPPLAHKGDQPRTEWVEEELGHLFVRDEQTKKWLIYYRKNKVFVDAPEDWQRYAELGWEQAINPSSGQKEKITHSDIFLENGAVDWKIFFKRINEFNKTRNEVFPKGTEGLTESEVISHIRAKYRTLLAGTVDPIEFPELVDEDLRPLCDMLNKTEWARSSDGCAGHNSADTEHLNIGYGRPYLRIILDLGDPNAEKFLDNAENLIREWQEKYPNAKINTDQENIVSMGEEPRVIRYSMMFDISCPDGVNEKEYFDSEECRLISAKFFEELKDNLEAL